MGKPGATDWTGAATHSPELGRAEAVLGELARGGKVSAEDRARAEGALVDLLWTEGPADGARARHGLLRLGEHGTREDRVRIAAEAAAAGPRGSALFDALLRPEDNVLSPEEKALVRAALEESPEKTLRVLADFLDKAAGKERSTPRALADHGERAVLPRRDNAPAPQARTAPDGNGDGRPEGRPEDLMDRDRPLAEKTALAVRLGAAALPFLLAQLRAGDRSEEAGLFLHVLGRQPQVRRTLHAELRRMDAGANSELHGRIQPILRDIELHAHGPRDDGVGGHARPRDSGGGTTLLERALDLCDARELVLLATGRESAAVRLTLVRLGALRGATDPKAPARRE